MKKIAKLMTVLAVAAFTFASCEDVPNPFGPVTPPTTDGDDTNTELPYTSVNLNTGWSLEAVSADQPWSMGTSYVQATGYQKWDGAETKTNRAVEAWLVSPAFSTKGYENVKIWFDQTIKYATYTGWEANHKIYVSSNYDESDFSAATWEEVTDFKPEASKFSDWTLYSSGELQLPASMVGQEAIHIAFYFKAPAEKSTTWELKNFNIAEGIADNTGGSDTPDVDPDAGTEEKPYDVASAIAAGDKTGVFVKGYIVGTAYSNQETKQTEWNFGTTNAQASNLLLAVTATETDYTKCMPVALPSGSAIRTALNIKDNPGNLGKEVLLYGNLTKYFSQPGMKETSYAVLDGTAIGTKPGGGDTPSGEAKTVTVSQFLAASESTTEWYQLTGTVTHLEDGTYKNSTQYGNFDLVDETGTIYVYGVVAEKGGTKGKFAELMTAKGIKDGSKITIIGNRGSYNGTAQVANAYFVSVESGESGGGSGGGDTPSTGLEASFDNGQGDFTIEDKELGGLTFVWKADTKNKYMKASAFANSTNNAAESWLVSPAFSLKNTTAPVMTFNNACNYVKEGTITDHIKVMVYDGTNWTEATISNLPNGSSWNFVDSTVDLTSVAGKEGVKIAFRYVSTTAVAPTWEIKTVSVK